MTTYPNGGTPPSKITEDSPQWNCTTMGNHVCGHPNTGADYSTDLLGFGVVIVFAGLVAVAYKRFIKGGFARIEKGS